ncbi:hypothetical protein DL93DRAFT_2071481 [Clavulina sp. PMI_390]|nr:hypothetical protein DL93DRAFT_2071481 [Clavulina sp. PMI_390]
MMGFSWLSWICVSLLVILNIVQMVQEPESRRLEGHVHDIYGGPRSGSASFARPMSTVFVPARMVETPRRQMPPSSDLRNFRFPSEPSTAPEDV